ncbi:hypothetical protein ILYODFUR_011164 [Ilyodon furcidens]|uniref:Uncharacterized protein n=1 Tax=Ilyodon furcidens TaxID=33524 RepID=A0ABV0SL59_9TELE
MVTAVNVQCGQLKLAEANPSSKWMFLQTSSSPGQLLLSTVQTSQRPAGFSLHLGWCRVTVRLWSRDLTSNAPSSRL